MEGGRLHERGHRSTFQWSHGGGSGTVTSTSPTEPDGTGAPSDTTGVEMSSGGGGSDDDLRPLLHLNHHRMTLRMAEAFWDRWRICPPTWTQGPWTEG